MNHDKEEDANNEEESSSHFYDIRDLRLCDTCGDYIGLHENGIDDDCGGASKHFVVLKKKKVSEN